MRQQFSTDLAAAIRDALEGQSERLFVCRPGEVISYDSSTNQAKVQPLFMVARKGREPIVPKPVNRIPVMYGNSGGGKCRLPVQKGDRVALFFTDRELHAWLEGDGGPEVPGDKSKHDVNSAFCLPSVDVNHSVDRPDSAIFELSGNGLEVDAAGNLKLRGAKVAIGNDSLELLQLISDILQTLSADGVVIPPATTPTPLVNALQYTALKVQLDTLLKGTL